MMKLPLPSSFAGIITTLLFVTTPLAGQMDPKLYSGEIACDSFLLLFEAALPYDTLGGKGIRPLVTEYYLDHGCSFLGRPVAEVVAIYGAPDVQFEWTNFRRSEDRVYSCRYKLYTATYGDRYTFGDKWLHLTTDAAGVITYANIQVVDE